MFEATINSINTETKKADSKRRTLATLALLVKHLDKTPILNDAYATFDVAWSSVEYNPSSVVARENARCTLGFERCLTGEIVEVEVSIFRDDDSLTVKALIGPALLNFECEQDAILPSERDCIAAMIYGALKVQLA